jgi:hypothetical protein
LSEDELEVVNASAAIDDILRRPAADDIKKYLDELRSGSGASEDIDDEIPADFR